MKSSLLRAAALIACAAAATVPAFAADNVALSGSATQSSTFGNPQLSGAQNAIDGNTHGFWTGVPATNSISHTGSDFASGVGTGFAWWQVALDQDYSVDSIVVWNRLDPGTIDRLRSFTVSVWDDGAMVWSSVYTQAAGPNPSVAFDVAGIAGDSVRVQLNRLDYLNMAEVQVFGSAPVTPAVPEPGAWALMGAGLAALAWRARRRPTGAVPAAR